MSAETIQGCPLDLSVATLSAWRDEALPKAELTRLGTHIESCPACRARLNEYNRQSAALAAIATPPPVGGYGRIPQPRSSARVRQPARWRWVGSMGAVAAVLLLSLAFAQLFHLVGHTTHPKPMAAKPLSWSAVTTPFQGVTPPSHEAPLPYVQGPINMAVAPSDGKTAYGCSVISDQAGVMFYATHDEGRHWSSQEFVSESFRTGVTQCWLTLDQNAPETLLLYTLVTGSRVTFLTLNGGKTWLSLPEALTQRLDQIATSGSTIFGLVNNQITTHIISIRVDGGHTLSWTPIDAGIPMKSEDIQQFWANPTTGALLVETLNSKTTTIHFWTSFDSGQHWKLGFMPDELTGQARSERVIVQQPQGGRSWYICLSSATQQLNSAGYYDENNTLVCSIGGVSWQWRMALNLRLTNLPQHPHGLMVPIAITDSGDLLAVVVATFNSLENGIAADNPMLYRLPAGSNTWQSLGRIPGAPGNAIAYAIAPGQGILWALDESNGEYGQGHGTAYTAPYVE